MATLIVPSDPLLPLVPPVVSAMPVEPPEDAVDPPIIPLEFDVLEFTAFCNPKMFEPLPKFAGLRVQALAQINKTTKFNLMKVLSGTVVGAKIKV